MIELKVDLGDRTYPINIGSGLMSDSEIFKSIIRTKDVMIVSNETVAPLYLSKIKDALGSSFRIETCILPDGEKYKTLESFNQIITELLSAGFGRDCTLAALGGGVVGDITGYAAASYQRGVDFIQIPTTLLSQVDSSVGGKTGVNHPLGKNMIGAFHQPRGVVIDTDCLSTLPLRELSAGMAEVIKYGIICDQDFFCWLERNVKSAMNLDEDAISNTIAKCCSIKAEVVRLDEKESGVRALLNLGHTFGHAIESFMGYGNWLHGEGVAAGMVLAAKVSKNMGKLSESELIRIETILKAAGLPTEAPEEMDYKSFVELMRHDKKVKNGIIRYVLPNSIGNSEVFKAASDSSIEECVKAAIGK